MISVGSDFLDALQGLSLSNEVNEISQLGQLINEISAKYFHDSTSCFQRRGSFDRIFESDEDVDLQYLGEIFPFVNREQECIDLVKCLGIWTRSEAKGLLICASGI